MKILGVDPGLRITGYGVISVVNKRIQLIETGIITPKSNEIIQDRIAVVFKGLEEIVNQHRPEVMVLEKLFTHYRHATTACLLGHVRGVICLLCSLKGVRLKEHSVRRIRVAITGHGAASKAQTQGMVAHVLGIAREKLTPDASDALALAIGYAQLTGSQV